MSRNLIARIAVAVVFGPLIILMGYLGGYWLFGMVVLFATLGLIEFLWGEGFRPSDLLFWFALLLELSVLLFIFLGENRFGQSNPILWHGLVTGLGVTFFFVISALIIATGRESARELFWKHARLLWGFGYICLLYPFVFLLGAIEEGTAGFTFSGGDCLLFLFGLLWVGDTAAMGFGKWLGKHRFAPSVSPNKTVEGFVEGTRP